MGFLYLLMSIVDLVLIIYAGAAFWRGAEASGKSRVLWAIIGIVAFFALTMGIGAALISLIGFIGMWIVSRVLTVAVMATVANSVFRSGKTK